MANILLLDDSEVAGRAMQGILARGNHLEHYLNGVKVVDVLDNDPKGRSLEGILALQIHAGPPMLVEFKDILLKPL